MKKSKINELVTIYDKEARVATVSIWKGFGYFEHKKLKDLIVRNKEKFEQIGELIYGSQQPSDKKKNRGQPDKSFLLTRRHFTLLIMLSKNTPESIELKCRIENEFERRGKQILRTINKENKEYYAQWIATRKETKISTLEKNDTVKKFVEYATNQGSKSSSMYYMLLAKAENNALFFMEKGLKNVREIANIKQLGFIKSADSIIEAILEREMEKETYYKNIYKIVDQKLKEFSEMVGKSPIIMLEEMQEAKKLDNAPVLQ